MSSTDKWWNEPDVLIQKTASEYQRDKEHTFIWGVLTGGAVFILTSAVFIALYSLSIP